LRLLDKIKPVFSVIDIWAKFRAQRGKNQDQYDFESEELRWLHAEANDRSMCIKSVGHRTKFEDPSDPFINFGGSTAITGGVDTMLAFSKMPNDISQRELQMRGRDTGDASWILKVDERLNCTKVCDGEQFVSSDQIRYLRVMANGRIRAQHELGKELNVSQQAVSKVLRTLHEKGLIQHVVGGAELSVEGHQVLEAQGRY